MARLRQGVGDVNSVMAQPSVDRKICDLSSTGDSSYRLIELYLDNLAQFGKFTLGKFTAESYAVFPCPQHQRQFCIKPATRTGNLRLIAGLPGHCSALSW